MPLDRSGHRPVRIDLFDLAAFAAFIGLSVWVLVLLAARSGPNEIWTGTDGPFIGDQMQYLGWIEDASRHLLIGNPFQSIRGAGVYLHPGLAISGGLARLGLSASVAYLVWKPIAVITLFWATRSYVRSLLTGTALRRMGLVLALFYVSPASWLAQHLGWFGYVDRLALQAMGTEMWMGLYLWGYPFTALSVAAIPLTLLAYGRDRAAGRISPWAPSFGLLCAWLQPWQGATLLTVLVGTEVLLWLREKQGFPALLAVNSVAIIVPLTYYTALSHLNSTWALSGRVNLVTFPWVPLLLVLAPLGILGLLAYRLPAVGFQDIAVRVWPIAAIAMYGLISVTHIGTYPLHALQGLSIPFAILAVTGLSHVRLPRSPIGRLGAAVTLVVILIIPSGVRELDNARTIGHPGFGPAVPVFITASEQTALRYLSRSPIPGAVLAPVYLGEIVPAETGRQTWVGIYSWTPDYHQRTVLADELFSGQLPQAEALTLVESSRARFLLSDCDHNASLDGTLTHVVTSVRRFGCATVYTVSNGT
jgi:hypothetical protein